MTFAIAERDITAWKTDNSALAHLLRCVRCHTPVRVDHVQAYLLLLLLLLLSLCGDEEGRV